MYAFMLSILFTLNVVLYTTTTITTINKRCSFDYEYRKLYPQIVYDYLIYNCCIYYCHC